MSLYLGDYGGNTSGTILRTTEPVGWAGWGTRPFTHFVLLDSSSSTYSQYWWSTGPIGSANSLTGLIGSGGVVGVLGGTGAAELYSSPATTPNYGGGLRLYVVRGNGFEGSNTKLDYQVVQGFNPNDNSGIVLRKSGISSTTTSGANALAAKYLSLGYALRYVYGNLYALGSINRAISDEEIAQILTGDIQILDYFKHNLVELWDFQRSDESALTGLISGTQFEFIQVNVNMGWTTDAPLPVSRFRGKTTNRSVLAPVWAYNTASTDNLINIYPSDLSLNSSVLSPLQEHSIEPRNLSLSSNPLSTLSTVDILRGSVDLSSNNIILSQQVILTPGTYTFTSNDLTTQLYIDITKGSVVTQGKSVLIDTGYPSNTIDITQGNIALLGSNILNSIQVNVSTGSVTSSGNQVNIDRYIEILAGNSSVSGSNIYIDADFPYLNIDITPSNISTLGNQVILNRVANLVINKGDIHTLGSDILVHTQADNLINIAYGSIEVLGSGVVVISGEPYDSGRRLRVTKQDYILRVKDNKYVLRLLECL